jgi:hypothetical protein
MPSPLTNGKKNAFRMTSTRSTKRTSNTAIFG